MESSDTNKKPMMVGIATLAIGLLIGGGIGYASGMQKDSKTATSDTATSKMSAAQSDGVTVGGAKMVRSKDIVDNAVNASNVTTVVAAVKAAGLVDTLKSAGPFTVFAPDNDAFAKLPAGTVDTLLLPENKAQLSTILTYHVVSGTYTTADLMVMAQKGESLMTVQGAKLSVVMADGGLKLKDTKGNLVGVQTADVISSNGVTHVIDSVLMPQ